MTCKFAIRLLSSDEWKCALAQAVDCQGDDADMDECPFWNKALDCTLMGILDSLNEGRKV